MTICSNASCPRCCGRQRPARWPPTWPGSCPRQPNWATHRKVAAGLASQVAVRHADPDRPPAGRARRRRLRRVRRGDHRARTGARAARSSTTAPRCTPPARCSTTWTGRSRRRRRTPRTCAGRWRRHFAGVPTGLADSLVAYLECAVGHPHPIDRAGHRQPPRAFRPVPRRPSTRR